MFARFVQNAILLAADFTAGLLAPNLVPAHLPSVFQPLDGLAIPWKSIALHDEQQAGLLPIQKRRQRLQAFQMDGVAPL